ncbi:beta-ketoacyl-[acyl-carrier-protein] synthase family protein [Chitiniphilus eburneus]|nr:beta-ketoacyl-[acyl-carrier-protein] synthase family protein [Chitiniphilus eburneus]
MKSANPPRIVVTGMGAVTTIGRDVPTFFANALAGAIGISAVRGIDVSRMNSDRGGEVHDFDIAEHFPGRADLAQLGRAKQLALAAARQCVEDAGFPIAEHAFDVGVALGYTQGESKELEFCCDQIAAGRLDDEGLRAFAGYAPQTVSQGIGHEFGACGPMITIGNACSASNFAIGAAIDLMRRGDAVAMIVGGADAFSRYGYAGFSRLGAIAPDVPRPFSRDRQGMVPAEGAAMLFIETLDSALARGAVIHAEITGYGESCDAHHITQPNPAGIAQAARAALDSAQLAPEAVCYLSVHGTGTQASDKVESAAFTQLFGERIPPLSSVKSMVGHAMGAASAIECVAAVSSLKAQVLTPTMNHLGPDEQCPVDCVPLQARPARVRNVLKTASAFGGNNAVVLFRQYPAQED